MDDRFSRQALIAGWSQPRLAAATVAVVGCGALGNEVSRILAQAGVGRLLLCDPDRVSSSNLSRTPLFREHDVGRLKVEAAAEALASLAPTTAIDARPHPLVHGVGLGELRDASLVLGCVDSRAARLQLAGRCKLAGARYIDGGTHPWGGEARPYLDPEGPCYGCSLSAAERAASDVPWSCVDSRPGQPEAAAGPASALVGAWMAMIAARWLLGFAAPPGTVVIDGARGTTHTIAQQRASDCLFHEPIGAVVRVPVAHRARLGALRAAIGGSAGLLAWAPVQERIECLACGLRTTAWGLPGIAGCPRCRAPVLPRTTLDLDEAPDEIALEALGIAPREILPRRRDGGFQWFELCGEVERAAADR